MQDSGVSDLNVEIFKTSTSDLFQIHLDINEKGFNSLTNIKLCDSSKLKVIADDKVNVTLKQKFLLGWLENIVGKGENAGNQHFLLKFPSMFSKGFFFRVVKCQDFVVKG